jgi:cob(I)alamin adenosyltransferase
MPKKGLLIVYTGNGKGKTTAALGLALRMLGHDNKVSIIQFIKGSWKSSEMKSLEKHADLLDFHVLGRGCTFKSDNREADVEAAKNAWAFAEKTMMEGAHDLVILDELTHLVKLDMVDEETILKTLTDRPRNLHVVVTGRYATERLIEAADLVTEMIEVKHPLKAGIKAQLGIEF